jgi:hypothetical protein
MASTNFTTKPLRLIYEAITTDAIYTSTNVTPSYPYPIDSSLAMSLCIWQVAGSHYVATSARLSRQVMLVDAAQQIGM